MTEKEIELEKRIEKVEKAIITLSDSLIALAESHKKFMIIMQKVAKKAGWVINV